MQTDAQQSLDDLLSSSNLLPADLLRDMPSTYSGVPGTKLRMCLEILASYQSGFQPGYFTLEDENASYDPATWLKMTVANETEWPAQLDDPAEIIFEGGPFFDGKRAGTLRVCFVHQVSSPLAAIAAISGIWDIAPTIETTEAHGVLEFAIIWHQ